MKSPPEPLHLFFNALTFFTRVRAPQWVIFSPEFQAKCTQYLPWVGLLVGCFAALTYWLVQLILPDSLAILIAMVATLLLTGAIHEDGLADCCDGFGGGWEKQQILSIMKDSSVGSYGVIALVLACLIKFVALLETGDVIITLICGHCLSRFFPLILIQKERYVGRSEESKSAFVLSPFSSTELILAAAPALLCFLFLPATFLTVIIPCLALTFWLGQYFNRWIGGYTGDCLGCCQQLNEMMLYLWFCMLFSA
ncbi:MAG: adenosylcobinamide-GDP ribazoletransferase [Neptuniibacter caesariensis]|uniref:Adenosylcobinamide-GDP ribazoletransferase n=1 Tax=Neptuniibacter caesariensis TaxID=207954 RepID=A0A2G6JLI9_NEPCE|nr:MAG: adenosylcobinamide-GDP ribazoletransferase [Neptuniibacter caesariensis]